MAAAVRALTAGWTSDAVEVRSLALAAKHPMLRGAVRLYWERNPRGEMVFKVLSDRTWTYEYQVTYDPTTDRVTSCGCVAGQHNAPCYHRGLLREHVQLGKIGMHGFEW